MGGGMDVIASIVVTSAEDVMIGDLRGSAPQLMSRVVASQKSFFSEIPDSNTLNRQYGRSLRTREMNSNLTPTWERAKNTLAKVQKLIRDVR